MFFSVFIITTTIFTIVTLGTCSLAASTHYLHSSSELARQREPLHSLATRGIALSTQRNEDHVVRVERGEQTVQILPNDEFVKARIHPGCHRSVVRLDTRTPNYQDAIERTREEKRQVRLGCIEILVTHHSRPNDRQDIVPMFLQQAPGEKWTSPPTWSRWLDLCGSRDQSAINSAIGDKLETGRRGSVGRAPIDGTVTSTRR